MSHPKCPSTALVCHGASVTSGPSWRAGAPQPPQPLPHSWLRPSISVRNGGTRVSSQLCKLRGFTSNTHVLFPPAPLPVPYVLMFHLRNGIYSAQIKPPNLRPVPSVSSHFQRRLSTFLIPSLPWFIPEGKKKNFSSPVQHPFPSFFCKLEKPSCGMLPPLMHTWCIPNQHISSERPSEPPLLLT